MNDIAKLCHLRLTAITCHKIRLVADDANGKSTNVMAIPNPANQNYDAMLTIVAMI